jgi:hypothetical protein
LSDDKISLKFELKHTGSKKLSFTSL